MGLDKPKVKRTKTSATKTKPVVGDSRGGNMGDRRLGKSEAFELAHSRGYQGAKNTFHNNALDGRLQEFGIGIISDGDRGKGRFAQNYINLRG